MGQEREKSKGSSGANNTHKERYFTPAYLPSIFLFTFKLFMLSKKFLSPRNVTALFRAISLSQARYIQLKASAFLLSILCLSVERERKSLRSLESIHNSGASQIVAFSFLPLELHVIELISAGTSRKLFVA